MKALSSRALRGPSSLPEDRVSHSVHTRVLELDDGAKCRAIMLDGGRTYDSCLTRIRRDPPPPLSSLLSRPPGPPLPRPPPPHTMV
jgi:hypothetical protein